MLQVPSLAWHGCNKLYFYEVFSTHNTNTHLHFDVSETLNNTKIILVISNFMQYKYKLPINLVVTITPNLLLIFSGFLSLEIDRLHYLFLLPRRSALRLDLISDSLPDSFLLR